MTKTYPLGITQEMITAAEVFLLAKILEEAIEPVVTQYSKRILEKHQFKASNRWKEFPELAKKVILDPKLVYLLSNKDMATYLAETFIARDNAGLKVSHPENCPYLEAKNHRVEAENALLETVSKHQKLGNLKPHLLTLDERAKVIDLILTLLAPYVRKGDEIFESGRYEKVGDSKKNADGSISTLVDNGDGSIGTYTVNCTNPGPLYLDFKTGRIPPSTSN
jgi:hypothetical protein